MYHIAAAARGVDVGFVASDAAPTSGRTSAQILPSPSLLLLSAVSASAIFAGDGNIFAGDGKEVADGVVLGCSSGG